MFWRPLGYIDVLQEQPEACAAQGLYFVRGAGAAFYVVAEGASGEMALNRLQALWSLTVQQMLPGMTIIQARAQGVSPYAAIGSGIKQLGEKRNRQSIDFPVAGPFVLRSPRTGKAAVRKEDGEHIDRALSSHRHYATYCKRSHMERRH